MKKIIAAIACIVLSSVFLFGCSITDITGCGGQSVAPILTEKPWSNLSNYEKVTYTLERRTGFKANLSDGANVTMDEGTVDAEGTYTMTTETVAGNIYQSDVFKALCDNTAFDSYFKNNLGSETDKKLSSVPNTYTLFSWEYSLTYVAGEHSGKTDTMSAVVLMKTSSLMPVFSAKSVDMQSAKTDPDEVIAEPLNEPDDTTAADDVSDKSVYDTSYDTLTDYINRKNLLSYFDINDTTKRTVVETEIKKNLEAYDQDALYAVIRSHSTIDAGGTTNLVIHNAVHDGLYGAKSRNITFSSGAGTIEGVDVDKTFIDKFVDGITYYEGGEEYLNSEGKQVNDSKGKPRFHVKGYEMVAYIVAYQASDANHGPAKSLVYAQPAFKGVGQSTNKVLLSFTETDAAENGVIKYVTVGTISDYTMDKGD